MEKLSRTSRFLMQATLGTDRETLDTVAKAGIENWIGQQLAARLTEPDLFQQKTRNIWQHFRKRFIAEHGTDAINGDGNNPALPYKWYFHMAWWDHTLTSKTDLLRQRVAQALSEILVISDNSALELDAIGLASYYDLLYKNAFGSYTDLLYEVSLHPTMGIYLSHMNNRKAVPEKHIHPDENYAREIMQLFSIGLHELHRNGDEKLDGKGNPIPTYDNRDIKELARVFTGLKAHSYKYEWSTSFWESSFNGYAVEFEDGVEKKYKTVPFVEMTKSMEFDEDFHDRQPKSLLKGHISLPGGQDGRKEVREVVRQLVSHPSTAPFVARHMIARMVTSNPAPEYIEAVAGAFGPNGNIGAMVKEILTYPLKNTVGKTQFESAFKEESKIVQSQKLKSPLHRTTQLLLAFKAHNKSGDNWIIGDDIQEALQQHPLSAPTVFNFYKSDYTPHGEIEKSGLVAPEFEIHTSATSISYVNQMYYWFFGNYLPLVSTKISADEETKMVMETDPDRLMANTSDRLTFDLAEEVRLAKTPANHDDLIDRIGLLLTGKPTLKIKPQIKKAFESYSFNPEWVVQTIIFMIAISPEFTVQEA